MLVVKIKSKGGQLYHPKELSEFVLIALEQSWGFSLPWSYRKFLLKNNDHKVITRNFKFKGSDKGSFIHSFLGILPNNNTNLLLYLKEYKMRIPEDLFPIAYDKIGNLILLSVKGENRDKVYYWDQKWEADLSQDEIQLNDKLILIADSFDEFRRSLYL